MMTVYQVLNEQSIQKLMLMVFGFVVIGGAIGLAATSKKGKYDDTARMGFNMIVAMIFVAIGLGAVGYAAFGEKILRTLGLA